MLLRLRALLSRVCCASQRLVPFCAQVPLGYNWPEATVTEILKPLLRDHVPLLGNTVSKLC